MLPPILEIYVVWHPLDRRGRDVADVMVNHFQGSTFAGLIGGAVEVYVRSVGWRSATDAPRPIPFPPAGPQIASGPPRQLLTAVVPVIGTELAAAVQSGHGPWHEYLRSLVDAQHTHPDEVAIFPVATDSSAAHGTELGRLLEPFHGIGRGRTLLDEDRSRAWCRDLAQGVTQYFGRRGAPGPFGGDGARLTVFISHASGVDGAGNGGDEGIADRVRAIVRRTRLADFFATNDLQPGHNWPHELESKAATSALLAIRTSTYASRPWCQREMLAAKTNGMPVVVLDALEHPEERGSFLMDHVPRVPVRRGGDRWRDEDILAGLNLLVDECLKRTLWQRQGELSAGSVGGATGRAVWWAPHAPEPVTLVAWLHERLRAGGLPGDGPIQIVHPDPPMGPDEFGVLDQIVRLSGLPHPLDVVTPRLLAARSA